ncbi:tryptophan synthase subunit alpha [Lujinxingia litoralis]|uniref:tryptophan synthase n=1 Tax=Lujinxingia litoralis TaxID=2211119 RepID=A0A328C3H3_9DELT|nr:tryptophan synthase subunit alpha [Lujinxingia litoralis]RAL21522.1 tryptophan synthase subunit alpha [Lujinxingia litoralis]
MGDRLGLLEERAAQRRPLLMVALVTGDPHIDATLDYMGILAEAGVDVVELIVPFSEPAYHGAVLQRAMARAVHEQLGWADIAEVAREFRQSYPSVALVISTYLNRLMAAPMAETFEQLHKAGADALWIYDLPMEEATEVEELSASTGLALVRGVSATTSLERFREIARRAQGLIIWTGHSGGELSLEGEAFEERLRLFGEYTRLPIFASMGVTTGEEAQEVVRAADGVLIGSSVAWLLEGRGPDVKERLRRHIGELRARVDEASATS